MLANLWDSWYQIPKMYGTLKNLARMPAPKKGHEIDGINIIFIWNEAMNK